MPAMRSVGSSALITPAACVENAIRMDSVEYVPSAGSRSPAMQSEGREYKGTETTSEDGAAASGGRDVRRLSTPTLAAARRCHLAAARRLGQRSQFQVRHGDGLLGGGGRSGADLISDNLG